MKINSIVISHNSPSCGLLRAKACLSVFPKLLSVMLHSWKRASACIFYRYLLYTCRTFRFHTYFHNKCVDLKWWYVENYLIRWDIFVTNTIRLRTQSYCFIAKAAIESRNKDEGFEHNSGATWASRGIKSPPTRRFVQQPGPDNNKETAKGPHHRPFLRAIL